MKTSLQKGFTHAGLLLLVIVVVLVGLIGYKVASNRNTATPAVSTTITTQPAQTIKSTSDLDTAQSSLDSQNIDGDLNPSGYNQDVSSLL